MTNLTNDGRGSWVWGGSQQPYLGCSHQGCHKKVRPSSMKAYGLDHDCCTSPRHSTAHAYAERSKKGAKKS